MTETLAFLAGTFIGGAGGIAAAIWRLWPILTDYRDALAEPIGDWPGPSHHGAEGERR